MSGLKTPAHIRFHTLILLVPTFNTFLYLSYLSVRWNIRLVARLWLYLITTLSNTEGLWASCWAGAATMPGNGLTAFCLGNADLVFPHCCALRFACKQMICPPSFDLPMWETRPGSPVCSVMSEITFFHRGCGRLAWISLGACSRECDVDAVCARGRRKWIWSSVWEKQTALRSRHVRSLLTLEPICAHTYNPCNNSHLV